MTPVRGLGKVVGEMNRTDAGLGESRPSANSVQTLDRALDILAVLAAERRPVGLTDLERQLGLHKTTIYRLLQTLEQHGFVIKHLATRQYALGFRLLEYADAMRRTFDITEVVMPYLHRLSAETEETTGLFVREGNRRACIAQVESTQEIRRVLPLGQSMLLYPGSSGKVILAHLTHADRESALAEVKQLGRGPASGDWAELQAELEVIRRDGYATSVDEPTPGAWAVSAPILRRTGELQAVISVSGTRERDLEAHRARCGERVVEAARAISQGLDPGSSG